MSPDSPQTVVFDDMVDSSVPMSPNRVQVGKYQDVPDEGTVFDVSPVTPGFLIQPSGTAVQQPIAGLPLPQTLDTFSDSVLRDLIAFAQCAPVPGSDAPLTLPVYTMPSGLTFLPGQSSVQTAMASAVSSRPEGWSSGMSRTSDISREGPFDAYASPMDTEDSHHDGIAGLPVSDYVLYRPGSHRYESGIWNAAPSPLVSGVYRGTGVCSAVVSFPGALGTKVRRGGSYGGCGQSTAGRWYHVVEP